MTTFDQILPLTQGVLQQQRDLVTNLKWLVINRDLNGRVRFILPESVSDDDRLRQKAEALYADLAERIQPHAYPVESGLLYESSRDTVCANAASYPLEDFPNVWVVDRLATESNWSVIEEETQWPPRIVFFSIKGGVGRSTALAICAWKLAQEGRRVLVLDLDLESPGLSTSLLPTDRQPKFGITDWLVEDLVGNGQAIFGDLIATSDLAREGEIFVVPAHGANAGEYVAKLGRVWMPKLSDDGVLEPWSARLRRLLEELEAHLTPDVVLIDSRAGIDEVAASCITDLGANLILLFALEGTQTWSGYRILFDHWRRTGVAERIRERLQIVAGLVPELDPVSYLARLRESAYDLFLDALYDELAPDDTDGWNFDLHSEEAPHWPWPVRWHRGFAALANLSGKLTETDLGEIEQVFGGLLTPIQDYLSRIQLEHRGGR
jgi:hypothetical protein